MVIALIPMLLFSMIGSLIPSTYAATECEAIITSDPSRATVYVDGTKVGKTPYTHFVGDPFRATIRIEMPGYETFEKDIDVGSYEHLEVHAVLVALGGEMDPDPMVPATITTTVSTTVTSTSLTTTTATATTTATTTIAANTITTTATATVTSTLPAQTATTTIAANTITTTATATVTSTLPAQTATTTVASAVTTGTTLTVTSTHYPQTTITSEVTVGLPLEIQYGAIGIAVAAIAAAAYMTTKRRA